MRKIAPAFILTSIIALGSGSALALGDMNKNKKSPTAEVTSTQSATTSPADKTYTAPTNPSSGGAATASDTGKGGATADGGKPAMGASVDSSTSVASTSGAATTDKTAKKAMKEACRGLTASDARYQQNKCGTEASEQVNAGAMKGGPGASGGT